MARKKKDVQRELSQLSNEIRAMQDQGGNDADLRALMDKMRTLTEELNNINLIEEADRALASSKIDKETEQMARRFSFSKFFRELSSERCELTGVESELAQLGSEEAARSGINLKGIALPSALLNVRTYTYGGQSTAAADGGRLIATEIMYQEALRKRLVLAQAGAGMITGLVGNINLVEGSHVNASWEGELTEVDESKKTFTVRAFSPKRLSLDTPISKQLLAQSSFDVEQLIINELIGSHAQALESACFNGSGDGEPTGILNLSGIGSVVMGTNGDVLTYGKIVDLETAISNRDADLGSLCYITTPGVRGFCKQNLRSSGVSGYMWEGNELNGYRAFASNHMPSDLEKGDGEDLHAMLFGNFNDVMIGQWGGLDLVVDPYSMKKMGCIEVTLNAYHDVFIKRKESFAAIKDISLTPVVTPAT